MPFYDRIDFTVSRVHARSYLKGVHPVLREIAAACAEAFVKARNADGGIPEDAGKDGTDRQAAGRAAP
jgi:hypothetical protein